MSKGIKCGACCGLGTTDSQVMGEICCSSCDGSGWEEFPVVDTGDELHQILGEALQKGLAVPRPPSNSEAK